MLNKNVTAAEELGETKRPREVHACLALCVLRSCELCVERLATDSHYFAKPTKTLFNDIRIYFPMSAQLRVYKTVDRYICFAREYFAANPVAERLECRATTRRGTPCQRTPLPHNGYCPSHQHLAETEELHQLAA